MRRLLLILVGIVVLAAGCGGSKTTTATPETVQGTLPKATAVKGDAAAGKSDFAQNGCGACHTYKAAGSSGKVGPDLDNLASDAQKANQGSLEDYTKTSIQDPNAYVVPGFPKGVMPSFGSLSDQQLADLVAFLTQKS